MGFSFMLEAEALLSFPPRAAEHLRSSASGIIHSSLLSSLLLLPINMTQFVQMCFKGKGTSVLLQLWSTTQRTKMHPKIPQFHQLLITFCYGKCIKAVC